MICKDLNIEPCIYCKHKAFGYEVHCWTNAWEKTIFNDTIKYSRHKISYWIKKESKSVSFIYLAAVIRKQYPDYEKLLVLI